MENKIKVLVVVDAQNDFITGTLANKDAQKAVPNIVDKILSFDGDAIYLTMDTHYFDYLDTSEGKKLPVEHCMVNSEGWRIEESIYQAVLVKAKQGCEIKYIRKNTFGSVDPVYIEDGEIASTLKDTVLNFEKDRTFQHIKNNGFINHIIKNNGHINYIPMEIEMCGFCTDICVVSNALILKAYTYNFAEITVDSKCCAGVTPEKHKAALEVMKSCQINII